MNNSAYIVSIEGVRDKKLFFSSLVNFYAPFDVILTIWGKIPKSILHRLSNHKVTGFGLRRLLFRESSFNLNDQSLSDISDCLCGDELPFEISWGIRKGNTSLAHAWDWDDISIDGSELIQDEILFGWIKALKTKGIIESFKKIDNAEI